MKLNKISFCLISALFITSGCTDVTGSSEKLDYSNGQFSIQMVPADDDQLSNEQKSQYLKDAEKLAVRYVNNKNSTQTEIPKPLIDLFYNGLVHIVNSDHPKADEVTNEYTVHARLPYMPREILIYADSTAPWMDAWRNETAETGNQEIDALIDEYNFSVVDFSELESISPTTGTTLRSDRAINGYAVGRLFEELPYVKNAGPVNLSGDGGDINVLFFDDYLRYTLEYGFGDCPAGCANRHIWHFRVHSDGMVEFESEGGDPLR